VGVYKNRKRVPASVAKLIKSQASSPNSELEDYETMGQDKLLKKLEHVVRSSFEKKEYPSYALTVDNFLKMSLIIS